MIGSLLILQFVLLLVYSYLYEINQAPFQIDFDPVTAFFTSWILLCIGIIILVASWSGLFDCRLRTALGSFLLFGDNIASFRNHFKESVVS